MRAYVWQDAAVPRRRRAARAASLCFLELALLSLSHVHACACARARGAVAYGGLTPGAQHQGIFFPNSSGNFGGNPYVLRGDAL